MIFEHKVCGKCQTVMIFFLLFFLYLVDGIGFSKIWTHETKQKRVCSKSKEVEDFLKIEYYDSIQRPPCREFKRHSKSAINLKYSLKYITIVALFKTFAKKILNTFEKNCYIFWTVFPKFKLREVSECPLNKTARTILFKVYVKNLNLFWISKKHIHLYKPSENHLVFIYLKITSF